MTLTTPQALRDKWRRHEEVALLDVRDEGPFSLAHPFFAVSTPLARLEVSVPDLLPRLGVPIVVYDNGEGLAERAVPRLQALGYTDVSLLQGGLAGYAAVGEVFRDVNVPSKAFGELVESIKHTPSLPASELQARLQSDEKMVVLDARQFHEYQTMSIPTGISVPGGELALRVRDIAPSPDTLVVVNCAGRTRSIIGTQSLIDAGIPNRVVALRNGTIGWTLAGLDLDHRQARRFGQTSAEALAEAQAGARAWAQRVGVREIDSATLQDFKAEAGQRTLYLLDVRTPEEYAAGHPAGFRNAPGGQLVQATDEWVGVRGARLVLFADDGVRALMTGAWLKQMGWDVFVLANGAADQQHSEASRQPAPPSLGAAAISVADLATLSDVILIDLATSRDYRLGHVPGAHFVAAAELRSKLADLPGAAPLVLLSPDGAVAAWNLADARSAIGERPVRVLSGGTQAWAKAGHTLETTPHWLSEPNDLYKRPYEGTDNAHAAMQAYIDWELGLVAQLANDGVCRFSVVR